MLLRRGVGNMQTLHDIPWATIVFATVMVAWFVGVELYWRFTNRREADRARRR